MADGRRLLTPPAENTVLPDADAAMAALSADAGTYTTRAIVDGDVRLYSLPVRHYTMVFRPQLYGFFLFNLEWAYAWYWNMKVFGLLVSMFLLLRVLTRNTGLALFGSLWLFFSSYVQWWFSCPPMLPEMLSSWALTM